jgi:hypothetical protein
VVGDIRATRAKTVERMANYDRVLCIQDTTELDFTGHPSPKDYDYRQGIYCHPTLQKVISVLPN